MEETEIQPRQQGDNSVSKEKDADIAANIKIKGSRTMKRRIWMQSHSSRLGHLTTS